MNLLEWARRHAVGAPPGNAVDDLAAGLPPDRVLARRGLPAATLHGVRTFFDLLDPGVRVCDGSVCHFHGGPELAERQRAHGEVRAVRCLGLCHDPPGVGAGGAVYGGSVQGGRAWLPTPDADLLQVRARPVPRTTLTEPPVVLRNLLDRPRAAPGEEYRLPDGDTILRALDATGLRGRGGAAYPTGAKWRACRDTRADVRYVVANGDEGDPGSFVDRVLMEEDPHAVLAGVLACARAVGARRAVVFVRGEYPRARATMAEAAAEARDAGWLDADLEVSVVGGAGSYVCGEETALLRAIEGLRGEPSPRPPFPAERGLFGFPTVVQNVETLAVVPWIARTGTAARSKGISVSGAVARPGLVEIAIGTPLRRVLEEAAGGPAPGTTWRMALVGGPMGRVIPAEHFDVPLAHDTLPGLGHGGVLVLDARVPPRALARHLYAFAAAESCGTCTPCRVGTARLAAAPDAVALERLLETLEIGSLCGFGLGVPRPLRDLLAHYRDELYA